jgi:cytochrome c oxidase assembly factor CtaG
MWWCVLETGKRRGMSHPVAILLLFVSMIQSGALGVILTFGPRPLYEAHAPWVGAWGLTRLEDQQLAGVIMWIPMGTWLALTAFVLFGLWIRSASKSVERAEAPVLLRPRHLADASDRPDNEGGRFDGEAIVLQTR